jgi:hypothetical protein
MRNLWWTKWRWGRSSQSTSVSPANLHSTNFFTITNHYLSSGAGTIGQEVAAVPKVSPQKLKKLKKKAMSCVDDGLFPLFPFLFFQFVSRCQTFLVVLSNTTLPAELPMGQRLRMASRHILRPIVCGRKRNRGSDSDVSSVADAWRCTHNHHVPFAVGNNDTTKILDMFRF